ncbi:MAG: proton-conducting transporter membrane subunit, partial [Ardenticatenaceae bacterium]
MIELEGLGSIFLPIWLPIVAAPMIYLVRRIRPLAALLAATVMGMVGWWLVTNPPQGGVLFFGRGVAVSPVAQVLLVGLAAWLVFAFLFSWRVSKGWRPSPFLLVVYGILAAALFFEELVLRVLLLKIACLAIALLVQGGAGSNTRAATRLLILSVLALPPFLVAATLIGQTVLQPDAPPMVEAIALALGMGFALMLAVIPFHAWLPQVAEDGPPLIAAWLVAGTGSAYLVLLFDLLAQYEWLARDVQVQRLLFGGGLLLAIGGGILLVTERHLGRLWAYAILADLGYILLGLSFNSRVGRTAVLLTIASRLLSLLLVGSALAT